MEKELKKELHELEEDWRQLPKKERKRVLKELHEEIYHRHEYRRRIKRIGLIVLVIFVVFGGLAYAVRQLTRPLPGTKVVDLGREHTTDIADIIYNSNPPTSGTHFPLWTKSGLYDRVISDGYLIHSLEHGYVILSYNCTKEVKSQKSKIKSLSLIGGVFAHEDEGTTESTDSGKPLMHMTASPKPGESWITPDNPPDKEVELPTEFSMSSCQQLVEQLKPFLQTAKRVIIVPRPTLDVTLALTAWGRIDKLDRVDSERITKFIKALHNRGPEQTME